MNPAPIRPAEDGNEVNAALFSWISPSAQWWSLFKAAEDGSDEEIVTI
jgi:hypothetical protein